MLPTSMASMTSMSTWETYVNTVLAIFASASTASPFLVVATTCEKPVLLLHKWRTYREIHSSCIGAVGRSFGCRFECWHRSNDSLWRSIWSPKLVFHHHDMGPKFRRTSVLERVSCWRITEPLLWRKQLEWPVQRLHSQDIKYCWKTLHRACNNDLGC